MYFGIGLGKTGTNTLCVAFEILGYKVKHYPAPADYKDLSIFDFVDDGEIPVRYEELDKKYPGSKFIYTSRDIESWLKSCYNQFQIKKKGKLKKAHLPIYGCLAFDEKILRKRMPEHRTAVMEYFKDRPEDLLVMNIINGDGWEKLCPFLGVSIPDVPWPHKNMSDPEVMSKIKL